MYKRKIESRLQAWLDEPSHKPIVVKGVRQCGKTSSVKSFAASQYKSVIYMDFHEQKELRTLFNGSLQVDYLTVAISAAIPGAIFIPNDTCIIFDEIQDCPDARTALKFFKEDGRYDIIATGSLLGVQGYGSETKKVHRKLVSETSSGIYVNIIVNLRTSSFASSSDFDNPIAVLPLDVDIRCDTKWHAIHDIPNCRAFNAIFNLCVIMLLKASLCSFHILNGCIKSSASLSSMCPYVSM